MPPPNPYVRTSSRAIAALEKTGLLSPEQVRKAAERCAETGQPLPALAAAAGGVPEETLAEALARILEIPFIRIGDLAIDKGILDKLPAKAVFQYRAIPCRIEEGVLRVCTADPFASGLIDALRLASGLRIRLAIGLPAEIERASKRLYGIGADTLDRMMQDARIDLEPETGPTKEDVDALDQEASVVKFVNQIIWEAHQERGTDIHIEPMETDLRIRYRIDGVLHQTPVPPHLKRFQAAIISRVKVMAGMDIAEKRLPQDGRIGLRVRGEEIDIRVSTLPTVYGESVSLRLLLRQSGLLGMDKLGLAEPDAALLLRLIHKPHGILLVTGPTGSGKSTSLYAWLHTINSIDKRIMTLEDPIEYEMPGINQTLVRPEIGLTFAVGLRHILRQDPDVIMVGEIRDKETAENAIRGALTGHLVFSTLHTNDAAGAMTRLVDMGIESFLVASSIEAVVAQRLVRRLCPQCRRPKPVDPAFLERVNFPVDRLSEGAIYEATGCDACRQTGYRGRTGIYEILLVNERIRPLVIARADSHEIKNTALRLGMRTLRTDGWTKVLAGVTTVDEVLRVSEEDEALSES
jgi:general secretion pathway protein E/type IV pilus assembly protein PilB